MPKVKITDLDGKKIETTTEDIESITAFSPFRYPHKECEVVGSKIQLKKGRIISRLSVEEVEEIVHKKKGRVRGKNKVKETE